MALAAILGVFPSLAAPAQSADLPAEIEDRIVQGVHTCLDYYEQGVSIATLGAKGFTPKARWVETKVVLPAQSSAKRTYFVRVLIENGDECEIHSNYYQGNPEYPAFTLATQVVVDDGYTIIKGSSKFSRAKSVFQKARVSMWFKVRNQSNILMVKFRKRPN